MTEPEADDAAISVVMTVMAKRRWAGKTKAEKLAFGRKLTATRIKQQKDMARSRSAKKAKRR